MFRILLLFSGLLGGLALAQITRERDGAAPVTGDEPADGAGGDHGRELIAVMVEPAPEGTTDDTSADSAEATVAAEGGVAPADATDDATDEVAAIVEAATDESEIDVVADGIVADELEAQVAARRSDRRVRALVIAGIAGIAAVAGLTIGYVAIRRVRPDLLNVGAIRGMRPAFAPPAVVVPTLTRSSIALPAIDVAEARRMRFPALEGRRLGAAGPAIRSAAASALASAIATSLARRISRG
jgi:hypothetical protein